MAKITPEQALNRLLFKKKVGYNTLQHAPGYVAPSTIVLSYDRTVGDEKLFYIINNETTGKSYLCPADDNFDPVVGQWASSTAEEEEIPPHMKEWLSIYEEEIKWLQNQKVSEDSETTDATSASGETSTPTIAPTLTYNNKWNQYLKISWTSDDPYTNKLTYGEFITGSRQHWQVSGCPATVVGQILAYWGKKGYYVGCKRITPYQYTYSSTGVPYYVDVDLPPISNFDFDNMLSVYNTNTIYSQDEKDSVSTLIQYTATSSKSVPGYTVTKNSDGTYTKTPKTGNNAATAASTLNTLNGIKNNFMIDAVGYSEVSETGFNKTTWSNMVSMIKTEIEAGRPVIIRGQRTKDSEGNASTAGHIFLCHGYTEWNGSKWLWINWGGKGAYDGWFQTSLLNMKWSLSSPEIGYNAKRRIIINVQPRHSKDNVDYKLLAKILNNSGKSISTSSDLFKELNFDYDDVITASDAETLARFIINDKDRTKRENRKDFKLAALVDIRGSLNRITNKLTKVVQ